MLAVQLTMHRQNLDILSDIEGSLRGVAGYLRVLQDELERQKGKPE